MGTRAWLEQRPWLAMHHHVALDNKADYERLFRFVNGTALGLVACGGGAFSAAHIGLYQALIEAGLVFDIMGGTSGGGAMTAAFALGADPDEIERRTHDIFVTRKALRRWTWPRYSLLDHTELDQALALNFTSVDIEDLWIPYFAVSTNLSRNAKHCHRSGPLWEAVRATSAVPAMLPPFFTADGEMLVDGCLLDNVPVEAMRSLKSGPNVVIDFSLPKMDRCKVDYRTLPSRRALLWRIWTRSGRRGLPLAPTPQAVLMRSLMLNRRDFVEDLGPADILLAPRIPAGVGHLDWHKHQLLREKGYEFARAELARLKAQGHPLLSAAGQM
jgi:NTE family protein